MKARHPGTPEDDATSAASVAAVYLEQATSLQRLGSEEGAQWHYRMAEYMARRATQVQPHNADLYLFLARVCREAGFLETIHFLVLRRALVRLSSHVVQLDC